MGGLVCAGIAAIVACGSSDDPATSTSPDLEAGADAPTPIPPGAGADAGVPGNALQHGGSRIEIQGTKTADGAFFGYSPFDTMLDSVCFPLEAQDGSVHCVPTNTISATTFSDATCTTRLASISRI